MPHRQTLIEPRDRTVLVADDDDDFRALVVEALLDDGYRVLEAHDGEELLDLLEATEGAARCSTLTVVADVRMPNLSGLGALETLKRAHMEVPVVMMTGFVPESVEIVAKRLGAVGVLKKPFDLDDLRTVLANVYAMKRS